MTEKCVNLFMFLLKDDLENPLALKFLRKTKTKQLIKLFIVMKQKPTSLSTKMEKLYTKFRVLVKERGLGIWMENQLS